MLKPRHLLKIRENLLLTCVKVTVVLENVVLVTLPEVYEHIIDLW